MNNLHEYYSAKWNYPTSIYTGIGKITILPLLCKSLNIKTPLLVIDPVLAKMQIFHNIINTCKNSGLKCSIFSDIKSNPTDTSVFNGVRIFKEENSDSVIAIGGGSAIDTAKAIALMSNQTCSLYELEDVAENYKKANPDIAPIIAVPTTAGTGAEAGRIAVITDTEHQLKRLIFHPKLLPTAVILDPEATRMLPSNLTAATGMDALSHSLEAFCAPSYHPMAESIAIEGIRLVKEYLPKAVQNGDNLEARMQMLTASLMGAVAFQRGLGAMHALAHPLGSVYDAHHGLLNAILMPYVLNANRPAIEPAIKKLSTCLYVKDGFDGFMAWLITLRTKIGIPENLSTIGIDINQADKISAMAMKDPSAQTNPILFSQTQYQTILENAISGNL